MTSRYVAWDGNTYPAPPPPGWYEASDHHWWPRESGPDDTPPSPPAGHQSAPSGGGMRNKPLAVALGVVALGLLTWGLVWAQSPARLKGLALEAARAESCDTITETERGFSIAYPIGEPNCGRAAISAAEVLGFDRDDVTAVFNDDAVRVSDGFKMSLKDERIIAFTRDF